MRKRLYLIVVLLTIVAISGCVTVKKVVRERVDQDITGNRGYIQGRIPEEPTAERSKTREYIDIRVEVPTMGEIKEKFPKPEAEVPSAKEVPPAKVERPAEEVEGPMAIEPAGPILYKVKEGDSLGLIAMKFYEKASKWTLIYEANMDKIDDPQRLKPGMELIIPELEKESEYVK